MKLIKCDMCTELVGDFQHEVLRVGDRNYDLHSDCVKKLKTMLHGEGEPVLTPLPFTWTSPPLIYPSNPPVMPVPQIVPALPTTTPSWPYQNPTIICNGTNSAGSAIKV